MPNYPKATTGSKVDATFSLEHSLMPSIRQGHPFEANGALYYMVHGQDQSTNTGSDKKPYRMAGLQWKDSPSAARVAEYTPKLSRKPRTVAMIMKAATAKRLSRSGGTL